MVFGARVIWQDSSLRPDAAGQLGLTARTLLMASSCGLAFLTERRLGSTAQSRNCITIYDPTSEVTQCYLSCSHRPTQTGQRGGWWVGSEEGHKDYNSPGEEYQHYIVRRECGDLVPTIWNTYSAQMLFLYD